MIAMNNLVHESTILLFLIVTLPPIKNLDPLQLLYNRCDFIFKIGPIINNLILLYKNFF